MSKKAMLFAAGLGTRLRPLTNHRPKALVEIGGTPLLEIAIQYLMSYQYTDFIINVHHFADQIAAFLKSRQYFGANIVLSDETDELLETGGGLKKASWFFQSDDKPFLVWNTDVVSDINLYDMEQLHLAKKALATLAVRNRKSSRELLFNEDDNLCGWQNNNTKEIKIAHPYPVMRPFAFSGIHIISPRFFPYLIDEGKFSIIDTYLQCAVQQLPIIAYPHNDTLWADVGKIPNLPHAETVVATLRQIGRVSY